MKRSCETPGPKTHLIKKAGTETGCKKCINDHSDLPFVTNKTANLLKPSDRMELANVKIPIIWQYYWCITFIITSFVYELSFTKKKL